MQRLRVVCILEEGPRRRTMAARPSLLLLCITTIAAGSVLQSRAQPDSKGFISIDCGIPGKTGYVDNATKLWQATDAGFTEGAGTNHNISVEFINPRLPKRFHDLRSFSDGARNCYTLRSLVSGLKYMVRAAFLYGNYDGLSSPPVFDLYVGVNFWTIVNLTSPEASLILEAAVVVPDSFVQVCLVNTGSGNPLISGLELRPLRNTFYPQVNATQGLFLSSRLNFGTPDGATVLRYPDDPHDRVWIPYAWVGHADSWDVISTTKRMQNIDGDIFGAPTAVMRTAVTPRRNASSGNIEFSWASEHQPNDPSPGYIVVLHIAELQLLPGNATREFYINMNGELWYAKGYTPSYLHINALYNSYPLRYSNYNVSINATANSTLPPIINAMEVFIVMPTATIATDSVDVSAITAIKTKYLVKKNWMGDPCVPKTLAWDNLSCRHAVSSPPRITSLNLSSSGLNGDISTSFANLKAVEILDLSNNNLSGSIPHAFSQLPSLTLLDLSGNQLSGLIPYALVKRIQDGSLKLRHDNNPDLCNNENSCQQTDAKRKSSGRLAIYITVPLVLTAVMLSAVLLLLCLLRRRRQGSTDKSVKPQNDVHGDSSLRLENRRFTYGELETITNNFQRVLGRGGFGYVYDGFLENGTQVAVKLRSDSSNQGVKEFLAEAQILTRVHHKNLVSMIGYCKDREYMALVYDYMSEGTLHEHIVGREGNMKCLPWRQRLRIALESAQGLEYLHRGCNPPLIHRDVKATNILLNDMLEAKIADFGLSKAFIHDNDTHVSTNTLVGTPGYVDPEYQATMQPTTKSDVYSFGVVLLELIAGKPAILRDPDPTSIIHWVQRRLARGNIESVVDSRMGGDHDINSVWKVADIALKCTAYASMQRPTMTDVVIQLQECLELEAGSAGVDMVHGTLDTKSYADDSNSSYSVYHAAGQSDNLSQSNTSFAMEHNLQRVPTKRAGLGALVSGTDDVP